jgi:hypothetical protein
MISPIGEFDSVVIRTTDTVGTFGGTIWHQMLGADPINLVFSQEEQSGDLTATFDPQTGLGGNPPESSDASFLWDFSLETDGVLNGVLDGDSDQIDFTVVLLEETPTFDILVGDTSMEHPLFSATVDSLDLDIDLGPVFLDGSKALNVVIANFWDQQITLNGQGIDTYEKTYATYFAPSLNDSEGPAVVSVSDPYSIDPALAFKFRLEDELQSANLESGSFDIEFTDGSVTHLSWLWCDPAGKVDASAVGVVHNPPASGDVNGVLDPDVSKVLGQSDFDYGYPEESEFTFSEMPVEAMYMGQVSMDVEIPGGFSGQPVALPVGLRIFLELTDEHNALETYDPELAQAIDAELGETPAEEEIEAVIRKYISFEKEWSTGETAEIKLDDEDFKNAVRIFFEYEGDDVIGVYFTANLLIINGGTAGVVDSVTVDGRTYIVIYDGTLDNRFADPIRIVAATEPPVGDDDDDATEPPVEDDDDSVSATSGGDGCSALGFVPAAGLLLMPLLLLLRK